MGWMLMYMALTVASHSNVGHDLLKHSLALDILLVLGLSGLQLRTEFLIVACSKVLPLNQLDNYFNLAASEELRILPRRHGGKFQIRLTSLLWLSWTLPLAALLTLPATQL